MAQSDKMVLNDRRILAIALPIMLSNATIPLMGFADTAVVGQLGLAAPIGAVGLGAVILTSVYWIFGFLRMGTSGLVAQARGANDQEEITALLMRGLLISAIAGGAIILMQVPVMRLGLMIAPASDAVEALTETYLAVRIWGAPAAIAGFAITGWLIAVERTKGVLILQVGTNLVNIGLSILLGLELELGVKGVAIATLLSEWGGLLLGLWLCRDAFKGPVWRDRARLLNMPKFKRMMKVNNDIMIRSILLQISFTTIPILSAGFGDVPLAANEVLLLFLHITAYALDGFAFAAETLVGNALGARNRVLLRQSAWRSSLWGMGVAALMALATLAFGPMLIAFVAKSVPVQDYALGYLPWVVLMPLLGMPAWMLDGIFIGATRSAEMRNAAVQTTIVYGLCLVISVPLLGNHGIWLSLSMLMIARGVALWRYYPRLEAGAEAGAAN